jgi:AbiV family abortive infection protein
MITSHFIIEGAVRAMEAAQAALRGAVKAYRDSSHATATILGAVAAEHLDRCRWLLDYAAKVGEAEIECRAFVADFDKYVGSRHEQRLQQSLYAFTSPQLDEIIRRLKQGDPTLQEMSVQVFKQFDKMRKRAGSSYHDLREQAQYVDPLADCTGWSTPKEVKSAEVHDFLFNVANSYGALLFCPLNATVLAAMKKLQVDTTLIDTKGLWPPPEGDAD